MVVKNGHKKGCIMNKIVMAVITGMIAALAEFLKRNDER